MLIAVRMFTAALALLVTINATDAQEREVGPCGGTVVSPTGRAFKCTRDKKPVCNIQTSVCYCTARPECRR
jgi:hypothetical protein